MSKIVGRNGWPIARGGRGRLQSQRPFKWDSWNSSLRLMDHKIHPGEMRIARGLGKSLFSGRIKIQGVEKIKNAKNKGFSQGVILRESKNDPTSLHYGAASGSGKTVLCEDFVAGQRQWARIKNTLPQPPDAKAEVPFHALNLSFRFVGRGECLKRAYKDDFGVDLILPDLPVPIGIYQIQDEEEHRVIPGIIFIAIIASADEVAEKFSRLKHSEIIWIDPAGFTAGQNQCVPDFEVTIKKAFEAWSQFVS